MKELKETTKQYKAFSLTVNDINQLVKDKLSDLPMDAEVKVSIDTPGVGAVYLEGSSIIAEATWEDHTKLNKCHNAVVQGQSRAALLPETIAVTVKDALGTWPGINKGDIYRVVSVERVRNIVPKSKDHLYIGLAREENDGK